MDSMKIMKELKLIKARSCDGCRANESSSGSPQRCILGHKVVYDYSCSLLVFGLMNPAEPCYKPRSNNDLVRASRRLQEGINPLAPKTD